jgi:hypothetical protein
MCYCSLWCTCICTYPMVMGSSSYCVVCSCCECLLTGLVPFFIKCVCYYLVFNSCNFSNIGIYASFICSTYFTDFRRGIFLIYLDSFLLLCFYYVQCIGYTAICVFCAQYIFRVSWIIIIIPNCSRFWDTFPSAEFHSSPTHVFPLILQAVLMTDVL